MTNFNFIMSTYSFCAYDIKYKLFQSYCMSIYGCVLWNISGKYIERFYVTWRKCIRRLLKLPYKTHSSYLPCIVDDLPVEIQIHKRFLTFFHTSITSKNNVLRTCSQLALNGSNSTACKNLNYIWFKYKLPCTKHNWNLNSVKSTLNSIGLNNNNQYQYVTSHITDLLQIRDYKLCQEFSISELQYFLEYFCESFVNN